MSEISGTDDPIAPSSKVDSASHVSSDIATRNWEERLAIARSEREKVLKAKGKSSYKATMKRPAFMDDDPAANWALSTPEVSEPISEQRADFEVQPEKTATEVSEPTGMSPAATISGPVRARSGFVSISWVLIVAFACFFGLGAGIVLSFGAVVAMGWVSVSDIAPQQVKNDQKTTRPTSPDIQTAVFKPLAPVVPTSSLTGIKVAPISAVDHEIQFTSLANVRFETDLMPADVQSPAPRFHSDGFADQLASRLDFQPASIAMTFATPLPVSASPAPFVSGHKAADALPVVPEKSNVALQTFLADIAAPTVDKADLLFASLDSIVPRQASVPVLASATPGVVPEIALTILERPEVFDRGIPVMAITALEQNSSVGTASQMSPPPTFSMPGSSPTLGPGAIQLPQVGEPHVYSSSLARELGITGDELQRFRLVTFAPANVTDAGLLEHSQWLESTGFPVSKLNRVNFKVSKTHIRYYRQQDEKVARALAREIGGTARNFSTARNRPPAGQVEVWLKGNRKGIRSASSQRRTTSRARQNAALKTQLENRLVNSLRRGEHLGGISR